MPEKKYSQKQFPCCPKCGKLYEGDGTQFKHSFGCPQRNDKDLKTSDLLLYHEFTSEAIRMLLPVVNYGGYAAALDSFCAALSMALKKRFGGSVQHLQTCQQDEPLADLAERKRFVFLYDSVPGGTGFLKDLLENEDTILGLLNDALQHLESCVCVEDETKDGCYQCLFAYRNSFDRDRISRKKAVELLRTILSAGKKLEKNSLTQRSKTGFRAGK